MASTETIKVRDVMTPNPVELPLTASAMDAAKAMRDSDIGAVVVGDGKGVCGIVTDRDLVVRAVADGKDPGRVKLEEICSRDLSGCSPDDGLEQAITLMRDKALRRLLVIDGMRAVGIVSIGDLAQRIDSSSVLGQISSAHPNR